MSSLIKELSMGEIRSSEGVELEEIEMNFNGC